VLTGVALVIIPGHPNVFLLDEQDEKIIVKTTADNEIAIANFFMFKY
jgi:hypothetical protein